MQSYACPQCQIEQIDPFLPVLYTLVEATVVRFAGAHRKSLRFTVPYEYIHMPNVHVQLRCIRLDTEGYQHKWPRDGVITLESNKDISIRPDLINIPMDINLDMTLKAHFISLYKRKDEQEYAYAVVIVGEKTVNEVISMTLCQRVMDFQQGQNYISSVFTCNNSLQTECWRVSLLCPFQYSLLETPVRGWKCLHLQCFDLRNYLILQQKTSIRKWKCPLCCANCSYLVVDEYMEAIAKEAARVGNCTVVEFRADGRYCLVRKEGHEELTGVTVTSMEVEDWERGRNQVTDPFEWKCFLAGEVSEAQLHASKAYQAALISAAPHFRFLLKQSQIQVKPRVSLSSISTVRNSDRFSLGSSAYPICLD